MIIYNKKGGAGSDRGEKGKIERKRRKVKLKRGRRKQVGKPICNRKIMSSLLSVLSPNSIRVKGRQVIGPAEFSPGSQPRPVTLLLETCQALSMQSAECLE